MCPAPDEFPPRGYKHRDHRIHLNYLRSTQAFLHLFPFFLLCRLLGGEISLRISNYRGVSGANILLKGRYLLLLYYYCMGDWSPFCYIRLPRPLVSPPSLPLHLCLWRLCQVSKYWWLRMAFNTRLNLYILKALVPSPRLRASCRYVLSPTPSQIFLTDVLNVINYLNDMRISYWYPIPTTTISWRRRASIIVSSQWTVRN